MQVSIQLIYMSCFPQPFDKIFMCSLQINHCLSHLNALSTTYPSVNRLAAKYRSPEKIFQAAGHFYLSIYLFIYLFFFSLLLDLLLFILLLFILLLLVVGDIPFSGDFNKSAVRWDQNKLIY